MDLFGDPSARDPVSPFVQLLWEQGNAFEKETIDELSIPFVDLAPYSGDEKERLTAEAMACGESLIYSGRIQSGDLLGEPDLLRREGGGYIAGDIKSGSGETGTGSDSKLKKEYAMQLALYTDVLDGLGKSPGRYGFVWDVHGLEVAYDLMAPQGQRKRESFWDDYQAHLAEIRGIIAHAGGTLPAAGAVCKDCHWHRECRRVLHATDDLTLIPELGRSKRDVMIEKVRSVSELAASEPADYLGAGGKTVFRGIGPETLETFHERARLLVDPAGEPYLKEPVFFPQTPLEIFFDIEVDPMRDVCYLHGFIERRHGNDSTERYIAFFTDDPTPAEEERAFKEAWHYLQTAVDYTVYYYSKYERTIWRKLQEKYPHVCSADDIERLFDPGKAVDLYLDVVKKHTEWPTNDHSIKSLAKYLGFGWRDTHPSGAASIEWFHKWVETGDPEIKQRILDYNEDDCRATRVLLDGIRALPLRP